VLPVLEEGGENVLRTRTPLGVKVPLHASATARAMLAFSPVHLSRALENARVGGGAQAVHDPVELLVELASVRERGYSVEDPGAGGGTRTIGAPVFDHTGQVVAGLGVSTPAGRVASGRVGEVAATVVEVARSLSEALGFDPARHVQGARGERQSVASDAKRASTEAANSSR
jgi:IclR family acetate operon transcriptional repressor